MKLGRTAESTNLQKPDSNSAVTFFIMCLVCHLLPSALCHLLSCLIARFLKERSYEQKQSVM